ncbi:unnamed protein product, partial [Mesorhabditis spiculigera]
MVSKREKQCQQEIEFKEFTIFHKREPRSILIKIEFHPSVAKPQMSMGGKPNCFPCELIGTESKKPKNLRARFHPEAIFWVNVNSSFMDLLIENARQTALTILGAEDWAIAPVELPDPRKERSSRLRQLLGAIPPHVDQNANTFSIVFPLLATDKLKKKQQRRIEENRGMLGRGSSLKAEMACEAGRANVHIRFEDAEFSELLWSIVVENVCATGSPVVCTFEVTAEALILIVPKSDVSCSTYKVVHYTTYDDMGRPQQKKMRAIETIVADLKKAVDAEALAIKNRSESVKTGQRANRKIILIGQTDGESVLSLGNNIQHLIERPDCLQPLAVAVDVPSVRSQISPDSLLLSSSPADSTDSGVGRSPTASPKGSMLSPFYQQYSLLSLRQRSYSENCSGIKGILKWPLPRTTFNRSVSEEHEDEREVRRFMVSPPLETAPENVPRRLKRISFSETIDVRTFIKGSCIMPEGQNPRRRRDSKGSMKVPEQLDETSPPVTEKNDSAVKEEEPFEKPGLRTNDRQDSGFCDGDEEESLKLEHINV